MTRPCPSRSTPRCWSRPRTAYCVFSGVARNPTSARRPEAHADAQRISRALARAFTEIVRDPAALLSASHAPADLGPAKGKAARAYRRLSDPIDREAAFRRHRLQRPHLQRRIRRLLSERTHGGFVRSQSGPG